MWYINLGNFKGSEIYMKWQLQFCSSMRLSNSISTRQKSWNLLRNNVQRVWCHMAVIRKCDTPPRLKTSGSLNGRTSRLPHTQEKMYHTPNHYTPICRYFNNPHSLCQLQLPAIATHTLSLHCAWSFTLAFDFDSDRLYTDRVMQVRRYWADQTYKPTAW